MKKILAVLFILCTTNIFAQNKLNTDKPKLVVTILIDGMQTEHLSTLWNYFEKDGLKKIVENGAFFQNTSFNYLSGGKASDCASLCTGTTPSYHGIIADHYFLPKTKETLSIVSDARYAGIGTEESLSAQNLYASTFSDELKLTTEGKANVFSIAANATEAIIMGGHAANSAVWVDSQSGKLVTSSYYDAGFPSWCDEKNMTGAMDNFLNFNWEPLFASFTYNFKSANDSETKQFSHKASDYKTKQEAIRAFKQTPAANKLIRRLALDAIKKENLGKNIATDALNLTFTVNPPIENAQELLTSEKEDMYLRLDKELKILFDSIDNLVGFDKTLIVLTANQNENFHPKTLEKQKINNGIFNAKRATALLNNYLMLLNGQGDWVSGCQSRNIYLNQRLAEKRKLDFRLLEYQTEQFMIEFQGIQSVYITNDLNYTSGLSDDLSVKVKNSIHPKRSGSIFFTLLPGWIEVDGSNQPIGISGKTKAYSPLVFYGWKIKQQRSQSEIRFTDIAPSICRILQTPLPNACTGNAIPNLTE